MEQLIESIMVLSRVSHRELQYEPVDLSALVRGIAMMLQQVAPERDVIFSITPGLVAQGDPGLLRIALENLMANAWKYSRDVHPARIEFSCYEEGERRFFCVADNGIGFDMAEAERLFRPFGRLTGGRAFPGVGIGLTTVKRIVLRHGGEIRASALPGSGASFSFSLGGREPGLVP
jgi:signal transduction histidine kinase